MSDFAKIEAIKKVLENNTASKLSKIIGVSERGIGKWKNNEVSIEKMSLKNAIALTQLADMKEACFVVLFSTDKLVNLKSTWSGHVFKTQLEAKNSIQAHARELGASLSELTIDEDKLIGSFVDDIKIVGETEKGNTVSWAIIEVPLEG